MTGNTSLLSLPLEGIIHIIDSIGVALGNNKETTKEITYILERRNYPKQGEYN